MDKQWFELFSDKNRWNDLVNEYIEKGTATGKTPKSYIFDLWEYFKYCLVTENKFFFDHPLLKIIKKKIIEHEEELPVNSTVFRARIDNGKFFANKSENLLRVSILKQLRDEGKLPGKEEIQRMIDRFSSNIEYDEYEQQYLNGFEGFNAEESSAPPVEKANAGRCNLPHIPHLYAAKDMHTAVAEVRPYISDVVSVATLSTNRPLKLINFYYNLGDGHIEDEFFWAMSSEFTFVNKGNENQYYATQYLTMLIKSMGYDGIIFKSSLVYDGINYVIFDSKCCTPISSKLYHIPSVKYELMSVSNSLALKDSEGNNIPDPPINIKSTN